MPLTHCPEECAFVTDEVRAYDFPFIERPRTVLDLGAHIGAFTALVHDRWPDARIVACEPEPENARIYRQNFSGPQFVFFEAAARSFEGRAEMRRGLNSACHSFHELGAQNGDLIPVRCLDAATLPAADLIKIDTEGCEWELIQRLDLAEAKTIVLEYHRAEDRDHIKRFLQAKGFYLSDDRNRTKTTGVLLFTRRVVDRLCIATPVYDRPNPFFATSLIAALNRPPCHIQFKQTFGDSPVGRSRNGLTADFLASNCSDILFIDSDLVFSADHIARIREHAEPVVGGLYPKKQLALEWVLNTLPGGAFKARPDGLAQVAYVGTGFVRIKREVFEAMLDKWGEELRYTCDHDPERVEWNLWPIGVYTYPDGRRRYLSEDWYFCQRWLDLGGAVWADMRVMLKHCGTAIYPLDDSFLRVAQGGAGTGSPGAARQSAGDSQ